ncbi:MAG TPA: FprA family A-type flavoprotein [Candidatus Syntrophosphaera thermopropionivorans]|nr:FprA family A-type flavoprotein [Candidatus Syntrophosphaera thermopropionivorans]HOQ83215.1 FprA family A-type flavoprotein [Candidatus Syntrophosphaera thermopropionivorans]HQP83571.1 FprA family A-type flavoprotein [Candidatus Syntrophosphaera thermopropionivorans]HRR97173.1 FprA family A-type flavoprotein [Candidatus Syntrophosphaera sp.]HRU47039.1 FprA family A-type flavoprotein [Candidatus Syntrophosphaera sp.]
MKAYKLKDNIYWVGAIDWNLRNFHGYITPRGSTYNAYLIIDEKVTLIDNVKYYLFDEMLARISDIIDPHKIDIIVQNHIEMDHSSGLPQLMKIIPEAKIYTNASAIKGLKLHYHQDWNFQEIKSGDSINIGKNDLTFLTTPMVHWPDNQVTYCPQEKLLFSNDAFGQHIASNERFESDFPLDIVLEEAKKYYANIVLPYSRQVQKVMEAVSSLEINMIAPSHGLIWTEHIPEILNAYNLWSNNITDNQKALVIYDTMWKSTEIIAYAIAQAFENKGIKAKIRNLQLTHISDIMTEVMDAKYICVGSPTINSSILPTVAAFMSYLQCLAPKDRIGLAFGSYGWSGQSVPMLHKMLGDDSGCGFKMLEPVKVQFIPDEEILNQIRENLERQLDNM